MKWLKNSHKPGEINYKTVIQNVIKKSHTYPKAFAKEDLTPNQGKEEKATFNISHELEANKNSSIKMALNEFPFSLSKW